MQSTTVQTVKERDCFNPYQKSIQNPGKIFQGCEQDASGPHLIEYENGVQVGITNVQSGADHGERECES
jgi:hypothetical protein